MPLGRPTIDPKRNPIKLRVNDEMYEWLIQNSVKNGKSLSQVIRDLITKEINSMNKFEWD